jgi:hypothetical protein
MQYVEAIVFGLFIAAPVAAQDSDTVRFASSRDYDKLPARVQASPSRLDSRTYGRVRRVGPIFEIDTGTRVPLTLPRGQQFDIDILVGHRRAAGALIGATAGVVMMVHALSSCRGGRSCFYCKYDGCDLLPLSAPVVVGFGATIETVIGWGVRHWVRIRAQ